MNSKIIIREHFSWDIILISIHKSTSTAHLIRERKKECFWSCSVRASRWYPSNVGLLIRLFFPFKASFNIFQKHHIKGASKSKPHSEFWGDRTAYIWRLAVWPPVFVTGPVWDKNHVCCILHTAYCILMTENLQNISLAVLRLYSVTKAL